MKDQTMKNVLITPAIAALRAMAAGDAPPSFRASDFGHLLVSLTALAQSGSKEAYEVIGRVAVEAMLDRLNSSMHAERSIALMRGNGQHLC